MTDRHKFHIKRTMLVIIYAFLWFATGCSSGGDPRGALRVGHSGGNLMAALYVASDEDGFSERFALERMESSSTVAYALLAGDLDAGFVDADKLEALSELKGFDDLTAVGKVTYPYGSTLILRKGLNLRINELGGLKIAVSSPECVLLAAFREDAERLNADLSGVTYVTLPFDAMIPALESGTVDAAVIKGFYSVVALQQNHSILYQNWDVKPGDKCCPAIIDQAALVLLARQDKAAEANLLADALVAAQGLDEDLLRQAIASKTTIPYDILSGQPVAEFHVADDELIEIFVEHANEEEYEDDNDENEE